MFYHSASGCVGLNTTSQGKQMIEKALRHHGIILRVNDIATAITR
jgi:hypothetical protein